MKITKNKLIKMIELLPNFDSYKNEYIDFQVHQTENVIFTLEKSPIGINVDVIRFVKNQKLQDWEMIIGF